MACKSVRSSIIADQWSAGCLGTAMRAARIVPGLGLVEARRS